MQPQKGGLEEGGKNYRHPCISQEKQHPHTFHDNGASFIVPFLLPVRPYMTELVVVLKWFYFYRLIIC